MNTAIGIYTNCDKDVGLAVTSKLYSVLTNSGFAVYLHKDVAAYGLTGKYFEESSKKLFDTLLTVGGDGTILRIASFCAEHNISILGINLGHVGFLTELELSALNMLPQLLRNNEFVHEKRTLLSCEIFGRRFTALNDIVVSRQSADRMIGVEVYVDGRLADKYNCDGYIVSTPTGSTAYSLSAGGCVLSPNVKAFSLLPINSHSLHSRPIVVDDDSQILVSVISASDKCCLITDGQTVGQIDKNQKIKIVKSNKELVFLRLKNSNFYEKLLSKLNTWSVTLG